MLFLLIAGPNLGQHFARIMRHNEKSFSGFQNPFLLTRALAGWPAATTESAETKHGNIDKTKLCSLTPR